MKKLIIFVFLLLISGTLFAGDVYVSDIVVPAKVVEGTHFEAQYTIGNTYDVNQDVNITVILYNPQADHNWSEIYLNQRIPAHDFNTFSVDVNAEWTIASTAQHDFRVIVSSVPDGSETDPLNNIGQRWFVITQQPKRIPIPDMPIYFGFAIALIAVVFLSNKKDKK